MNLEERKRILDEEWSLEKALAVYKDLQEFERNVWINGIPEWANEVAQALNLMTGSSGVFYYAYERCCKAFYKELMQEQ